MLDVHVLQLECRAGINSLLIDWFAAATERPVLQAGLLQLLQLSGAFSIKGRPLLCALTWSDIDCAILRGRCPSVH